jgi:hypothetical protein
MKTIVGLAVAVCALWCADALLNEGRYGQVIEGGFLALIGR